MKPTDKEYPELLAKLAVPPTVNAYAVEIFEAQAKREGVKLGYQLALDHTNHAELLEAAKNLLNSLSIHDIYACHLGHLITKSETSKLK